MPGSPKKRARKAAKQGLPPPEPAQTRRETWAQHIAQRTENEQRRDHILGMMSRGQWLPGASEDALAERWNITPRAVKERAEEASKLMRMMCRATPEFQESVRAEVLQTFRVIRAMGMRAAAGPEHPGPDATPAQLSAHAEALRRHQPAPALAVALQATRLFGFYTGVEPAKKIEDVTPVADPFEGWTLEQKREFAETGKRPKRALAELSAGRYGIAGPPEVIEAEAASVEDADTDGAELARGVH